MRIGLLALQDAGVTVNVDVVRAEFEKLLRQAETVNDKAAQALEQTLRANFADGDGRLPRTLERFLGDRGALRSMVDELFDESKRDSAIGRIGSMLERYFDGDASKLALLLDPTRLNSPMHQFRQEMTAGFRSLEERLVAIEAAAAARGAERARSAAKGGDFEDLLEAMLADLARGAGDLLDRTGTEAGALMKSKKGDFVLTLDARVARGCDLRVVIEAKDRPMSMRAIRDELREAQREPRRGRGGRRLHAGPRPVGHRAVRPGRRRRLLRHRPRGARAGHARGRRPARPAARARVARRARGRGGRRGDRGGPDRHPRAARGGAHAQGPADLDLDRDEGRLDGARHDALEHPRPGDRRRDGDPRAGRIGLDRPRTQCLGRLGPRGRRRAMTGRPHPWWMHRRIAPLFLAVLVALPVVVPASAAEPARAAGRRTGDDTAARTRPDAGGPATAVAGADAAHGRADRAPDADPAAGCRRHRADPGRRAGSPRRRHP